MITFAQHVEARDKVYEARAKKKELEWAAYYKAELERIKQNKPPVTQDSPTNPMTITLPQISQRFTFTPKSWAILLAERKRPIQRWRTCFLNTQDTEPPFMHECKAKFVEPDHLVTDWRNGNETHVLFNAETWEVTAYSTRSKRRELIERRGDGFQVTRRYENY